jgi:protein dithiol oxidoreductase (disulfide-forming)
MRTLIAFLALALALPALPVLAADAVEGKDYARLARPQAAGQAGKVEVLEFFSWGCHHCYDMHPKIDKWASELRSDAVFVRVPLSLGYPEWGVLSRTYYALETMGAVARMDAAIFKALHQDKVPLFSEANVAAWLAQQGIDGQKFRDAFNSSQVTQKALRAEQMSRDYQIDSTPTLTVDGKYIINNSLPHERQLAIASELIEKIVREAQRK